MKSQFPSQTRSRSSRLGVTLVELLVVMAVIGILIGILVPVVGPMVWRASEHVIHTEQTQLSMQIEAFNNKYGFYPPDFSQINTPQDFLPYLNKISNNHNELGLHPDGSGDTRLERWWNEVGVNITPATALPFWLSGLRSSSQYPLTHPDTGVPAVAYSVDGGATGEREVFFDFKADRLLIVGNVAGYGQPKGDRNLPYIYFSSDYSDVTTSSGSKEFLATTGELIVPYRENGTGNYFEQFKFQIISPGLDNKYGSYQSTTAPNWTNVTDIKTHRDNIMSFKGGRLDKDLD